MKVNTDGVLLGALTAANNPLSILDIGTGTGVMALMLAQRFLNATIDAIEIDKNASETASKNFSASSFAGRLNLYSGSFQEYFKLAEEKKYDLIVSNPPFFIDSLKSGTASKILARHTNRLFFEELFQQSSQHLNSDGVLDLILPIETADFVTSLCTGYCLNVQKKLLIKSFHFSEPHRHIVTFGSNCPDDAIDVETFVIYQKQKEYSSQYQILLKDFLTIF